MQSVESNQKKRNSNKTKYRNNEFLDYKKLWHATTKKSVDERMGIKNIKKA
jgi:hypothetical protein